MLRFKSAILAIFQFCQNGTFEPVHEIQNFFWSKAFFWSFMKMGIRKTVHNLSQGLPNPGFIQEKVQKGDFLKKDSRKLNFFSCFRLLWISRRPGMLNWERVVFLTSKILYNQCGRGFYFFEIKLSYHLCVECFSQLSFDSEVYTKSATAADFVYISESNTSCEKHSTQRW